MLKKVYPSYTIVIPAYNEAKTIGHVVNEALKIKEVSQVIVVDDGSSDDTKEAISDFSADARFLYLRHRKNKGKGGALKTGIKAAKTEVVQFLDADLTNITAAKIRKIALPVLTDEVDLSRGKFRRKRGRVTEYAVKPMMKILFPDMYFEQPISGQICAKKEFLVKVDLENRYGVDIGLLFDAIESGERIVEVDIGKLQHKANSEENIAEMSRQVLETMIKKAGLIQHKYNLVVFTLDNTLVKKDTLKFVLEKFGKLPDYLKLKEEFKFALISFEEYAARTALLFEGLPVEEVANVCKDLPLVHYAPEVIAALKKRKYQVAIVSSNLSPIVLPVAKRLGVELLDCIYIEKDKKGEKFNGKISKPSRERWLEHPLEESFKKAYLGILRKTGNKTTQSIMVANSHKALPLIEMAGLGVAFSPEDKVLKDKADKTVHVLAELLAIVE